MTVTYCDITKEEVENGTLNYSWTNRDRMYYTEVGRDMSKEGKEQLEQEVYKEMAKKDHFSFKDYKKAYAKKLLEMTE